MDEKTLLLVTVGRTDLKSVLPDNFGRFLKLPSNFSQNYAHNSYEVLDYAESLQKIEEAKQTAESINEKPKWGEDYDDNATQILPVKLTALIKQLKHHQYKGKLPDTVVVLNTNRYALADDDRFREEEPYAFGEILAKWLAKQLKLNFNGQLNEPYQVTEGTYYLDYVDGKMSFDGNGKDDPVNRLALSRIQQLLQNISKQTHNNALNIIYSPGGGAPKFKPQIEALCELYANKVYSWHEPEKDAYLNDDSSAFENVADYPSPNVSFSARKQCIALIKQGNFQGAAALAMPFTSTSGNKNRCDHGWADALIAANAWLQGAEKISHLNQKLTTPLPFNSEAELPNSLWCAFRIEAALKMGNFQDAIRLTCDLSEIMLQDYFANCLTQINYDFTHSDYSSLAIKLGDYNQLIDKFTTAYATLACKKNNADELQKPFSDTLLHLSNKIVSTVKAYNFENDESKRHCAALDIICSLHTATVNDAHIVYQPDHLLIQYEKRLRGNGDPSDLNNPKTVRNTITHGYLSQSQMDNAKHTFCQAGLWHKNTQAQYSFLAKETFEHLFSKLIKVSQQSPLALYNQFTNGLISQLKNAPTDFEETH